MKTKMLHFSIYLLTFLVVTGWQATAQNGATCYRPLVGASTVATPINGSTLCASITGPCNFISGLSTITDNDTTNLATSTSTLTVGSGRGVSVADNVNTYPAGYYAGFILNLGSTTVLNATLLNAFTVSTYNDGQFRESSSSTSLVAATAVGTAPGRYYLYFKTTQSFDEVRFIYTSTAAALDYLGIYYATAFDPNCGTPESNNICGDQVAGTGTTVLFNAGSLQNIAGVNVLTSITDAANITDGNKNSFATLTVPVTASVPAVTTNPYVSVLDEKNIYPAGSVAGFVVARPGLASVDLLNGATIQTYLFGTLQDAGTAANGLLRAGLLTGADDRSTVSITTTKPYNEVRLVISRTVTLNVGTLRVYYAFEQPPSCSNCVEALVNPATGTAPYSINTARTGETGTLCISVGGAYTLSGTSQVIDADTNNSASYSYPSTLGVSVNCGFRIAVRFSSTIPAGAVTGFSFAREGGLLNTGVLGAITINTYNSSSSTPNTPVSSSTNANLLGLSVISPATGGKSLIAFRSTAAFNEVELVFTSGLVSASLLSGGTFRTYYPFVIRDDDGDGVPNCQDNCATGNDALDSDGNGVPDCADIILPLTLGRFTATATPARKVVLDWETLQEKNTRQFVIERSGKPATGADWTRIGTKAAAGTSSGSRTYSFTDLDPIEGINYYRLRTIDLDGKETISPVRQINLSSKALLAASLYPNPVKPGNTVQVTTLQPVHYRMLDKTGRTVKSGTLPVGNNTLQVPAASGVYIVEVETLQAGMRKETHKLVVQ